MVALTIDGKRLEVPEGTTILEASKQAGVEIPHLCHHDGIHPYGACRVCTVEVTRGERTKLMAACSHKVDDGLEVRTDSERVRNGRKVVLELLLARCPEVEEIRELASRWGAAETRFETAEGDDCILCGLCVRACRDVVGAEVLGFTGRGTSRVLARPQAYDPETCIGCGLCTYVCPTGAVQMEADRTDVLGRDAGTERTCRYMLMGLVSSKTCPENYQCWRCPYDQLVEASLGTHPALALKPARAKDPAPVGTFLLERDRSYSSNHLWLRDLGGRVMVGVDDLLGRLMGPLDEVEADDEVIRLAAGSAELRLQLPASMRLLGVNPVLHTVPRLVNYSPYRRGWIAVFEPAEPQANGLYDGQAAVEWFRQEVLRLEQATGLPVDELTVSALRECRDGLAETFIKAGLGETAEDVP